MPSRILVVEDEPNIALGLKGDLELEGYEVDIIDDGSKALAEILSNKYNLILLDIMLPGKDGLEICRELRKTGNDVPIICLTAKTKEAEIILGLDYGADDYITKPFSPRELRARIRTIIRRCNGSNDQTYQFMGFELNIIRMELTYNGSLVKLTPIEFKLLLAFLSHPGIAMTRDLILNEVWGGDVFLMDRVVDTHIANLRKKLTAYNNKASQLITTVRGTGYRFDK